MTRHSKVFVPVSVSEREGEQGVLYFMEGYNMKATGYFSDKEIGNKGVTHWLEEKENVYVLTEKEFKILLEETWMNGHGIGCHNERHMAGLPIKDRMKQAATDIEQFLQSKTNPQT